MSVLRQCGVLLNRHLIKYTAPIGFKFTKSVLYGQQLQVHQPLLFGSRGHKNFGHAEEKTPLVTKLFHLFCLSVFVLCLLDWRKIEKIVTTPKADANVDISTETMNGPENDLEHKATG